MTSEKFRIRGSGGAYIIEGIDSNGRWVVADPSAPVVTLEEAQKDLDQWESIPRPETSEDE